ncbi:MAG: hypothetical protein K2N42_00895 [Anaeroplasmataceae bacterium]|nr:hypothetical protein [Anaeroplasmataceae bacterium]
MNEKEIVRYIIASKTVSIPEVQKRFGLGYKEAHSYFTKLIKEEKLSLKDDLHFEYNGRVEKIPPVYLKALWDCIEHHDVDSNYIKAKYNLSTPTVNIMLEWMKDNEFIEDSPFPDILLTKQEFIERFGIIEEEQEEDNKEIPKTNNLDLRDLRKSLEQRRRELLKRLDALPTEKKEESEEETDISDDIDIKPDIFSMGLDLLKDKAIREKMKAIITINSKITLEEFLNYVEKKHIDAIIGELKEREDYQKILNVISQFEEEDFLDLKEVLLS